MEKNANFDFRVKVILKAYHNLSRKERKDFVSNRGEIYTSLYTYKEWVTPEIVKLSTIMDILNAEYTVPTYGWDVISTTHYLEWNDKTWSHEMLHRLTPNDIYPREDNMGDFVYVNILTIPMLMAMGY